MIEVASFEFPLAEWEWGVSIFGGEIGLRVWRQMRTTPMTGMKQPLLNHAIMGTETLLALTVAGAPAVGLRWRLYRVAPKRKFLQRGVTDQDGESGDLNIDLEPATYRLVVFKKGSRSGLS